MAAYAHIQHMMPPTARGRCWGGYIACSYCSDHIQYAKFGACFQKCTNIVLSHWTIWNQLKYDLGKQFYSHGAGNVTMSSERFIKAKMYARVSIYIVSN